MVLSIAVARMLSWSGMKPPAAAMKGQEASMADLDELVEQQRLWNLRWRWEGESGHPRRLADSIVQVLEEGGYHVQLAEGEIKAEPLAGVAEFQGAAIGTMREPKEEALKRKWGYLVAGALLVPLILGIFMLVYAFKRRTYYLGLHWRGEMYKAEAHVGAQGMAAQRANVISEVRMSLRSAAQEGDSDIKGIESLRKIDAADTLAQMLEASVPRLALRPYSEGNAYTEGQLTAALEADELPPGERPMRQLPKGNESSEK